MSAPTFSIVVVSRDRPAALRQCLMGIEQLFLDRFELVVVADAAGLRAVADLGLSDSVKPVPFETPNISAARNAGITVAAGDLVAFIDDDAVPEPTWADQLVAPFSDPDVMSAGGYVRGRNGISWQSRGAWVDSTGAEKPEQGSGVLDTKPGRAIKTVGTNCAFRRDALAQIGGFDPAFRFYLDETDVNMRLAAMNCKAAIVPGAEVHHGFHASAYRSATRVPTSLYQIGASLAVFLRKHHDGTIGLVLDREVAHQKQRLDRLLVRGDLEPRDLSRLMASLEHGFAAGQYRDIDDLAPLPDAPSDFQPFRRRMRMGAPRVIVGRSIDVGVLAEARAAAARGQRPSLFQLSPTALFHRVWFDDGVWRQSGGIYGRSDRADPIVSFWRRRARLDREVSRVADQRGL